VARRSNVCFFTAGRYQNVNALVATGSSHKPNLLNFVTKVVANSVPAVQDPKFAASGLDLGYLTSRAGTRTVLYNTDNTDPKVIEQDERLKQTGTAAEIITVLPEALLNHSREINIPILAVNGGDDPLSCGPLSADCSSSAALIASERPFYGPRATLDAIVVPNAGHDVTLARSAPQTLAAIQSWVSQHVKTS
jgi:pimeloyl-ACP methyl ester carboxylesterase